MNSSSPSSTTIEVRDEVLGKLVLGRYRVVRQLARGGMGVVYLGRIEGAAGFAKPVVIKRISPDMHGLKESRALFAREARILSNLQHPGIVAVLDFGEEQGAYVMVLEYVHGYDVAQWLKYWRKLDRFMPAEYAVYIIVHVLEALHYAHTLKRPDGTPFGIVHRDVSPGNVLIDAQGNVKLLDFGIARTTEDTGEFKTQDGSFKGKLAFVAPEVYHGSSASVSSDVYSCGVLLYQLLTGVNPFSGGAMTETVRRVLTHTPSPISARRDDLPDELDEAVMKAIDKDPSERFPKVTWPPSSRPAFIETSPAKCRQC